MPDWMIRTYAAFIGAVIGSFLNVCVYRWPNELSVVRPRSRCPSCEAPIAWYDNIPILSWIILRGRCRQCGARISIQYPLIELASALIWVAAVVLDGWSIEALRMAVFLTLLLGIALTDAKYMLIPDQFSLGGVVIGLALAAIPGGMSFKAAVFGAAFGYAFLWLVKILAEKAFRKPALGVGDIHMIAMVGAFVGVPGTLLTILLGSLFGLLIGVPYTMITGKLKPLGTYLPLGVFLALGGAISYMWGDRLFYWYLNFVLRI
jgi:leader peptidase (prepilin peptidase)/N-methyltransferase